MAETGKTPIQHYRSSTPGAVPLAANMEDGEISLNTADTKVFMKSAAGVVTGANIAPIDPHIASTANPHSVTKTQVGLANVTNDAQLKIASNLSDVANAATSRTNLGLSTGATSTVTTSATDTTTGRLLKVGDFGVGRAVSEPVILADIDDPDIPPNISLQFTEASLGTYPIAGAGWLLVKPYRIGTGARVVSQEITYIGTNPQFGSMFKRDYISGAWSTWREIYHSGNIGAVEVPIATTDTTDATSTTAAPLKTAGGLAVAKSAHIGGALTADEILSSTRHRSKFGLILPTTNELVIAFTVANYDTALINFMAAFGSNSEVTRRGFAVDFHIGYSQGATIGTARVSSGYNVTTSGFSVVRLTTTTYEIIIKHQGVYDYTNAYSNFFMESTTPFTITSITSRAKS